MYSTPNGAQGSTEEGEASGGESGDDQGEWESDGEGEGGDDIFSSEGEEEEVEPPPPGGAIQAHPRSSVGMWQGDCSCWAVVKTPSDLFSYADGKGSQASARSAVQAAQGSAQDEDGRPHHFWVIIKLVFLCRPWTDPWSIH